MLHHLHTASYVFDVITYACVVLQMSSVLRGSQVSLSSAVDVDIRQVFTQIGSYKGSIVAIRKVNKRCIDLTRNVQKELKMVNSTVYGITGSLMCSFHV